MAWSTSQLADLAGTTVKTVRHYHEIGLLEQPTRASNGYKQYETGHLVRLLRIRRLVDLGVPLSQIRALGDAGEQPDDALRVLDAELASTIERLQKIRAELAMILRHHGPTDLPPGFSDIAADISDADRALILIYSRVLTGTAMDELRTLMQETPRSPLDAELDDLPADADEETRIDLAARYAPYLRSLTATYPWLQTPDKNARRGEEFAMGVVGQAIADLYNPAQLDVLRRAAISNQESTES